MRSFALSLRTCSGIHDLPKQSFAYTGLGGPAELLSRDAMSEEATRAAAMANGGMTPADEAMVQSMLEKIADMCQSREKEQSVKLEDWAKDLAAREAAVATREAAVAQREAAVAQQPPSASASTDRVQRGLCETCGVGVCSRSTACFDSRGNSLHHHNCHSCYRKYKADKAEGSKGRTRGR